MGRSPRILIEGGIYHVYNRVSHGEHVFRDEAEAEKLLTRLLDTKRRDGFQVLAWCTARCFGVGADEGWSTWTRPWRPSSRRGEQRWRITGARWLLLRGRSGWVRARGASRGGGWDGPQGEA